MKVAHNPSDSEPILSRTDLVMIADMIPENAKVLDLGCGSGRLLHVLKARKHAKVMGVELDQEKLIQCMDRGVPVSQADLNEPLSLFSDNSYDYVILSRTLQAVQRPDLILQEMLRIGGKGIISIMNFGQLDARMQMLAGHMPVTKRLPLKWYDTPNIHPGMLSDFRDMCREKDIKILKEIPVSQHRDFLRFLAPVCPNLFASNAIFVISR